MDFGGKYKSEKEIRDIVSLLLTGDGYMVQTAEDGQAAVEAAAQDIDLYILDVNMPRLSGIMAAAEIRKTSGRPIIFLTAYSSESDKVMGFSVGADDYIVKPFSNAELLVTHKKKIFSLENIYQNIWDDNAVGDGTIMAHIRNIRKKLGDDSRNLRYIRTAWGRG